MRPIGAPYSSACNTALIAAAKARASRKLNPASSLHAQLQDDAGPNTRSGKGRRRSDLCRSGTDRPVPFRYGPEAPRLEAAFVTQMLGQMMPARAQGHRGALAAYEEMPRLRIFLDTHL